MVWGRYGRVDSCRLRVLGRRRIKQPRVMAGTIVRAKPHRLSTDNAWAYTHSNALREVLAELEAKHVPAKQRHPSQNGNAELFSRTLSGGWAYRGPFTGNPAPKHSRHG